MSGKRERPKSKLADEDRAAVRRASDEEFAAGKTPLSTLSVRERRELFVDLVADAEEKLARIFAAFGYAGFRDLKSIDLGRLKGSLAGLENDGEAYERRRLAELRKLGKFFAAFLGRVDQLRSQSVLLRPAEYEKAWKELPQDWNDELRRTYVDAKTIPRLCEACGTPVFLKKEMDADELSRACASQKCAATVQKRTRRAR